MLTVGSRDKTFTGDVTTLNWIGAKPRSDIERGLGYGGGRLAAGYYVLLLIEPLTPGDFEFGGTTLRSGGKHGLPASTQVLDDQRRRVHDDIVSGYGADGYRKLQEQTLKSVAITGPGRIAKVLPHTRHDSSMAPDQQYPMGGGGLQWKLVRGKRFLVAMHVAADGMATTPGFSVSLRDGQPFQELYQNRAKVIRYLETAR